MQKKTEKLFVSAEKRFIGSTNGVNPIKEIY